MKTKEALKHMELEQSTFTLDLCIEYYTLGREMNWRASPAPLVFAWVYNIYPCPWPRKKIFFCLNNALLLETIKTSSPPPLYGVLLPRVCFRGPLQGGMIVLALGHESNAPLRSDAQGWTSGGAEEALVPAVVCPSWLGCWPRGCQVLLPWMHRLLVMP